MSTHLYFFSNPPDIESQYVACACVVQLCVVPFASTSAVEAMEADIQAGWIVLIAVSHSYLIMVYQPGSLTIESKH